MRFLALIALSMLCACGAYGQACAWTTGASTICIDNVRYIVFPSGATVKMLPNGRIETCEGGWQTVQD